MSACKAKANWWSNDLPELIVTVIPLLATVGTFGEKGQWWQSPGSNLAKFCHHCFNLMPPKPKQKNTTNSRLSEHCKKENTIKIFTMMFYIKLLSPSGWWTWLEPTGCWDLCCTSSLTVWVPINSPNLWSQVPWPDPTCDQSPEPVPLPTENFICHIALFRASNAVN